MKHFVGNYKVRKIMKIIVIYIWYIKYLYLANYISLVCVFRNY